MRQNSNENQVKNKIKAEQSLYNPVPLHRSYGVTSKERPWMVKIKTFAQKAMFTYIIALIFATIAVGICAFMFASGSVIIPTVVLTTVSAFAFLKLSKPARKRIKLINSLKKLVKNHGYKYGYKIELSNGILSPKWSNGKGMLTVYTNSRVYYIRIFAVLKYRSRLKFMSENEMTVTRMPIKNVFSIIYDFKTKTKKYTIDFSEITETEGKETVKAVIICPTCEEWSYKHSHNAYVPTGNAETVFGYKVYTASGFISDLCRTEEE